MKRISTPLFLSATLVTSLAGCLTADEGGSRAPSGPGGGKGDDARVPSAHLAAVRECEAAFDEAFATDPSARVIERFASCLADADTAAAAEIQRLSDEGGGEFLIAPILTVLDRSTGVLCSALAAPHVEPADNNYANASCLLARAKHISATIDGYVYFGPEFLQPEIERDAGFFVGCYQEYENDRGDDSQSILRANLALRDCVQEQTRAEASETLAPAIAEATGATVEASALRLSGALDAVYSASDKLCDVVVMASGDGGGSLGRNIYAGCLAEVATQIGILVSESMLEGDY